jgi:hypothetical protein
MRTTRRRRHHRVLVVADDVADQHHLRPAMALGLGGVADRAHVAFVEVLEAGEQHAGGVAGAARLEVVGDLDDRRHRLAHLAEELQADRARCGGILCSTQRAATIRPSVPSFCTPGRPARNLSVTSLPRPALRKVCAGHGRGTPRRAASCRPHRSAETEAGDRLLLVDLAEVVVEALDLQPVAIGVDHLPPARLSSAVPHSTAFLPPAFIAMLPPMQEALGRGRIDGEDEAGRARAPLRGGDHAGAGADRSRTGVSAGQGEFFDRPDVDQLLGVDHDRLGVSGTAPPV